MTVRLLVNKYQHRFSVHTIIRIKRVVFIFTIMIKLCVRTLVKLHGNAVGLLGFTMDNGEVCHPEVSYLLL